MIGWVHVSLDLPAHLVQPAGGFWARVLGATLGEPWPGHPEFRSLRPPDGHGYVTVQTHDGPSRVHVDLEAEDLDAEAARLAALGATEVAGPSGGDRRALWRVLHSPGGLPFCLVPAGPADRRRPAPVGPAGDRTRLAQVCLDSPAGRHDAEVAFWRAATGWEHRPTRAAEFAGKLVPPPGCPVQFLLHRLGPDDQGVTTRAHLDLGCDDRETAATRLVAWGAERQWSGDGWVTLRDPAGLLFCATETSPDAP